MVQPVIPSASPVTGGRIPADTPPRLAVLAAAALIAFAALVAWHNSFSGAFVFDDVPTIRENLTIRQLWPPGEVLSPPSGGFPVSGRPLVNLTLAVNYALSGTDVWSYHVFNLAVHILAGLTLFGLVRRTLAGSVGAQACCAHLQGRNKIAPLPTDALALIIALLWTVHPLQTDSVTYVVQRTESLMGLLYLLTLYCFIRAVDGAVGAASCRDGNAASSGSELCNVGAQSRPFDALRAPSLSRGCAHAQGRDEIAPLPAIGRDVPQGGFRGTAGLWFTSSFVCCLLGMATKEVMVSAPLIVFLYDRTFVTGSFRETLRQRGRFYASLAATWLLLAWLVAGTAGRGGTAGFGLSVTPWSYALTQCETIVRYLGLSLWPHPLMIDYGVDLVHSVADVWWQGAFVLACLGMTIWALIRKPRSGFLGAWFFAILAPSSSVVPVATEVMAEHRMYLPLAAVIALGVVGLHRLAGRKGAVVFLALTVGLGWVTVQRNAVYRSEVALWIDAVTKRPSNSRAHSNLGSAWLHAGKPAEALAEEKEALRLKPDLAPAAFYAGEASFQLGQEAAAIRYYEASLAIDPDYIMAHVSLGNLHLRAGRFAEACAHYEAVVRKLPPLAPVHYNLAMARLQMGRLDEAITEFETVLRLQPGMAGASYNLGTVFLSLGRLPQAQAQFERTLQLEPNNSAAHNNLANILMQGGRFVEAVDHYRAALRSDPANVAAHCNLGNALLQLQRLPEAKDQFEAALRLQPDYPPARAALEQLNGLP